jgi:hypothetical protein
MDNNIIFIKKMVEVYGNRTIPKTMPNAPKLEVLGVKEVFGGHYIVDIFISDWQDVNIHEWFDKLVMVTKIIKGTLSEVTSVNFNPVTKRN